jgi:hypothetical protein
MEKKINKNQSVYFASSSFGLMLVTKNKECDINKRASRLAYNAQCFFHH